MFYSWPCLARCTKRHLFYFCFFCFFLLVFLTHVFQISFIWNIPTGSKGVSYRHSFFSTKCWWIIIKVKWWQSRGVSNNVSMLMLRSKEWLMSHKDNGKLFIYQREMLTAKEYAKKRDVATVRPHADSGQLDLNFDLGHHKNIMFATSSRKKYHILKDLFK